MNWTELLPGIPARCASTAFLSAVVMLLSNFRLHAQPLPDRTEGAAQSAHVNPPSLVTPLVPNENWKPLTGEERWHLYLRNSFWSPGAFFRAAGPAANSQLENEPPEWGQGTEGYSKRFANRFGRFTLRESFEAASAAALQHEVRYIRSSRAGFFPRVGHALIANFVTYDRDGHRVPNISRLGSIFAAEFTANLWMPDSYRTTSNAMRGAGVQIGVSSGFNLIREFAPELKRVFGR